MTATFTFRGDETLSKTLKIPVTVQHIGEQFLIEPKNVFLIAETGQMKGKPIQPENSKFLNLENGQKYEVVAAPRNQCHFTYNGRSISVEPGKATAYYLEERFGLSSVCLRQGDRTIPELSGEFKTLIVGENYTVEGIKKGYDQLLPEPTRQTQRSRAVKLEVLVPSEMLQSIEGTLLADFQTNGNIRKYIYLNKLFERQAEANIAAKEFKRFKLKTDIPEFKNFFSAVVAINSANEAVFQDIHRRFEKMFINVMQLPRSLLDAIDKPNRFENNVAELREIWENSARTHIKTTVALLQTEIDAIVSDFQKPLDLASKLCATVCDQLDDDGEEADKIKTVLESDERIRKKLNDEKSAMKRGKNAEHERATFADNSFEKSRQMPDEQGYTPIFTMRYPSPENLETGKDIKLMALLEFVDHLVLKNLPKIKEIDEHKSVNQAKYELLLRDIRSQESLVLTFRSYVTLLAELTSATAKDKDHTRLQHLHADLADEAKKLHAVMLKIDLVGTEKEKLAKTANCDKKVAVEKFQQYEQLIRQKTDEIARISREIERKKETHAHLSSKLEALGSVLSNLRHMTQLFNDILTGLLNTKEYINTVLDRAIDDFFQKMKLPVTYENENDARVHLELWYGDAIRVIGWAVQIATSSLVFDKLYEKVISPGLTRNTDALYCRGPLPETSIADVEEVLGELQAKIPVDTFKYIQTLHKPLNVTVEALTQGESPSDPEHSRLPILH